MTAVKETDVNWGDYIGRKVDFLRPHYIDKTYRKGEIVRLSEGPDPFDCVIVIDEEGNEHAIHFSVALSRIILMD